MRPARKDETTRFGEPLLKSIRQLIESVNDTTKASSTSKPTAAGPAARLTLRILALAAVIWHNNTTGAPLSRSLIAYDH